MTSSQEPVTERQKLLDWLDGLSTVNVDYAPAHGAPYFSKYIVIPGVEAFLDRIEAQTVDVVKDHHCFGCDPTVCEDLVGYWDE